MNLRGIVSVSGKPGLFKLIGQNKTGFILESLDGLKTKAIVNMANAKLASLEDITIFGEDDDLKLIDIFERMKKSRPFQMPKQMDRPWKLFLKKPLQNTTTNECIVPISRKLSIGLASLKACPFLTKKPPSH